MSSELGFVLIVALLLGPTAMWMGYRAIRGHQPRSTPSGATSGPMPVVQRTTDEVEAEVARDGFWVCWSCRSLNRQGAATCYACHTATGSADRPAVAEPWTTRGVPVMADGIARPVGRAPAASAASAAAPAPMVPAATAASPATAAAPASAATAVLVPGGPPSAAQTPIAHEPAPTPVPVGTSRPVGAAVSACPFLGFRDDPSTRCDFPDPRNVCHARPARGAAAMLSRGWAATGRGPGRSRVIDAGHQRSTCLSARYETCARYPAAPAVPPKR